MNIENMTKGADFLMQVPKERFNIARWTTLTKCSEFNGTFECGFAGCAMGWMAHAKVFPGLTIEGISPRYQPSKHEVYYGWDAAQALFGINEATGHWLFHDSSYNGEFHVTPKMVAERMRGLIERELVAREQPT